METLKKSLAAYVGYAGALALAGTGMVGVIANAAEAPQVQGDMPTAPVEAVIANAGTTTVQPSMVHGTFSFTQDIADSNETIRRNMGDAARHLCGSQTLTGGEAAAPAEDWVITVDGAVQNGFSATFGELAQSDEVQTILMGCSCAGNPADGRASVMAEVTGLPLTVLLGMAGVDEGANTVVFESADGYEVALPLSYVAQRYCPIVFAVNGSGLSESVGGTNQLWLGATSAKYFARDIVGITLEARDQAPAAPGAGNAGEAGANLPNVGVFFGGEVA